MRFLGLCGLLGGLLAACGGVGTAERSCATNADCGAQVCVANRCADVTGADCRADAECPAPVGRCKAPAACRAGHCASGIAAAGTPCDDGNACTDQDVCDTEGRCVSAANICACTSAGDCPPPPEGNPCQVVSCPSSASCEYAVQPDKVCGGAVCAGATIYADQRCDSIGGCLPAGGAPCPGRLKCDPGGLACRTSCASAGDCLTGLRCTSGQCVDPPCTTAAQCTVPPGSPACFSAACAGGNCQYTPVPNAVCGGAQCFGAVYYPDQRCTAAGACSPTGGMSCPSSLRCDAAGTACRTTCMSSSDCITNYSCSGGTCLRNDGQSCTMDSQCLHKCLGGTTCGVLPECTTLQLRVLAGGTTLSPTSVTCSSYPCTIRYLTNCANTVVGASGNHVGMGTYSTDPWKTTSSTVDGATGLYYIDVPYGNPALTDSYSNVQLFRSGSSTKSSAVAVVLYPQCTILRVQQLVGGVASGAPATSASCTSYPCSVRYLLDCGATSVGTAGSKDGVPYAAQDPWFSTGGAVAAGTTYYPIDVTYPDNSTAGAYDVYMFNTGKPGSATNHLSISLGP